ncbi:transglycosylase SLT domain-containing protein [Asticcacaulis taihuensis]|uniref:transglycosylase SLT domain-containing protein n=1 Tax=Asticcacaulis taihuensis TaxID=260084 RepID=UPI0026EFA2C9|nr:transglycosylase SLT domain-containing protein [Asticcacaulis taihuensis]
MTFRHRAFISLTVLGFALMASTPGWAATKHEPELRTATSAKKKPATEKTAVKKSETTKSIKKSSDDAKTVKASDKTTSKAKKTTEVADKTPAKGKKKTELADATPAKGKKKKADVADAKTSKKSNSKTNSRIEVAEACGTKAKLKTKKCKAAQLAAKAEKKKADRELVAKLEASKRITFLPAPFFPKQEAPVVTVSAGPVPYNAVAGQGTPITPSPLTNALSPADATLYRTAFDLMDKADYAGADAQLAQVTDKRLMGYALYHKLFSAGYQSTYEELTAWLTAYGDHPMAMKVWGLAKRKKPEGAPDPAFPLLAANATAQRSDALTGGAGIQLAASTSFADSTMVSRPDAAAPSSDTDLTPKSARSAYNNGQLAEAVTLGRQIGDHWVAGLACWRLKRYEEALAEFKFVSSDPSTNAWTQSSGAYWAARSAQKLGRTDDAETFLQLAASFPFTFYGLLAEERLGVDSAISLAKKGLPPTFGREQRSALTASLTEDFSWAQNHPRAQRLNALVQVGLNSDAKSELQAAIQSSPNREERDRWLAFGAKTHIRVNQLKPTDHLFDVSLYPIPDIAPKEGYKVDKALIFAIARKESKFNAQAHSYAGAYGLLQLMPATAALVQGDSSFNSKPKQLLIPAVNISVGQNYINRLQNSSIIDGDLLRTIAAYNAGARPVKDAVDSLGNDADSLLVMESIPVAQTRQYVEEVVANYWIYRQIMGKDSKTLAQAASDAKIISLSADSPVQEAGAAPVGDVALAEN